MVLGVIELSPAHFPLFGQEGPLFARWLPGLHLKNLVWVWHGEVVSFSRLGI